MKDQGNTAVFSLAYLPFAGGAELAVKEMGSRIKNREFIIFTHRFENSEPSEERADNVRVVRLGRGRKASDKNPAKFYGGLEKLKYVFRAFRKAEKLHRQKPFILIWGIMAAYGGLAALLFKLRHPKIPFLLTLQEGDSETHILKRVGIFYPIWKMIFKRANYIQAISDYLADFGRRHGAHCPIEIVPNGVAISKIYRDMNLRGKPMDSFAIITTSRLVYKNAIDVLIRATAKLKTENYKIKILIVGGGPLEGELKKFSQDLGVAGETEFLGSAPPEKVPEYLSQADIFVRPSRSEGLGSSFLEAMAAGLPIIGTRVGGIPEFLKDRETGLFAEVDNPDDLAEKINLLISDKNLREKITKNGRELALKNYSWDLIAEKMEKIFLKLSESKRKIVFAAGIYPPDVGGPALHGKELADRLREKRIKVEIVAYGDGLGRVSRKFPRLLRYSLYFLKVLRAVRRADLIYAQDATGAGLPAMLASKISRKPLYLRIGGDVLWERAVEKGERFVSLAEYYDRGFHLMDRPKMFKSVKTVLEKAKAIAVTTPMLKEIYLKFYQLPPEKIKIILNPVFLRHLESAEGGRRTFKDEDNIVLFAGRFVSYKNLGMLIKAFDKARQKTGRGELVLIGDGPDKGKLEGLRDKLISRENIKIIPRAEREEILKNISRARLCVGPALTEFNPNFILECLFLGTPAVISKENGLTLQLSPEFEFNPKNEKELEEKIIRFFDRDFYQKARENISRIEINRSWEDVLREHLEFFNINS